MSGADEGHWSTPLWDAMAEWLRVNRPTIEQAMNTIPDPIGRLTGPDLAFTDEAGIVTHEPVAWAQIAATWDQTRQMTDRAETWEWHSLARPSGFDEDRRALLNEILDRAIQRDRERQVAHQFTRALAVKPRPVAVPNPFITIGTP